MKKLFKILALVFLVTIAVFACKKSQSSNANSLAALAGVHSLTGILEKRYDRPGIDTITHATYPIYIDSYSNISSSIVNIQVFDKNTIIIPGSSYNITLTTNSSISIPNSICFTGGYSAYPVSFENSSDTIIYNYEKDSISWNEAYVPFAQYYVTIPILNYRLHTQ